MAHAPPDAARGFSRRDFFRAAPAGSPDDSGRVGFADAGRRGGYGADQPNSRLDGWAIWRKTYEIAGFQNGAERAPGDDLPRREGNRARAYCCRSQVEGAKDARVSKEKLHREG